MGAHEHDRHGPGSGGAQEQGIERELAALALSKGRAHNDEHAGQPCAHAREGAPRKPLIQPPRRERRDPERR